MPIDLIFPVYINQRVVFDFVATMQDGIATVTRATITENEERGTKAELGGSFGLGSALTNFFKIDAKAGKSTNDTASLHTEASSERYQTPTSLLARLISTLKESNDLKSFSTLDALSVGQLIEFEAVLSRNPMVETLDSALQGFEMFVGLQQKESSKTRAVHKPQKPEEQTGLEMGIRGARTLLADLEKGKTTDIVSNDLSSGVRAVVTLEREFLSDPSMANLVEGEFRVFGKVIRKIDGADGGISLLRNSTVGKLNQSVVSGLIEAVTKLNQFVSASDASMAIVPGPVFHVLPIAIYA